MLAFESENFTMKHKQNWWTVQKILKFLLSHGDDSEST